MNIIILLGAPGSGKGTVAGYLAAAGGNLKHVSSGDLLRAAVAQDTAAGREAKAYIESGRLVPDALIAAMIKDAVAEAGADSTMLLDGFPRNTAQAKILDDMGAPVKKAVLIDVPDAIIQDRIAGRRTCPKCKAGYHVKNLPPKREGVCDKCGAELAIRKDDNPETVAGRLKIYHAETEPLIGYYRSRGLLATVDGTLDIAAVAAAFKSAIA